MADESIGILSLAGFVKARGLYGAGPAIEYPESPGASVIAAGHQIPFESESITQTINRATDGALVGAGREQPSDVIGRDFSGSISGSLKYCGWERMIMCAMGFEMPDNSPVDVDALGSVYAHVMELDEVLQHQAWKTAEVGTYSPPSANDKKVRSGLLGFYKEQWAGGNADWVPYGVMIDKMTISGDPDGVEISFDVIVYDIETGSYNHANWTLPGSTEAKALFQQMVFKMGLVSGGYGSMIEYGINNFELTLENNQTSGERTTKSGEYIIQPVRSGFRTVSLKLGFLRYNSDNSGFFNLVELDGDMMASLKFTGPQIGSTGYYHELGFFLPNLQWTGEPNASVNDSGPVKPEFELVATRPDGSDGFVGNEYKGIGSDLKKDSELVVVIQNEVSDNYLIER